MFFFFDIVSDKNMEIHGEEFGYIQQANGSSSFVELFCYFTNGYNISNTKKRISSCAYLFKFLN